MMSLTFNFTVAQWVGQVRDRDDVFYFFNFFRVYLLLHLISQLISRENDSGFKILFF